MRDDLIKVLIPAFKQYINEPDNTRLWVSDQGKGIIEPLIGYFELNSYFDDFNGTLQRCGLNASRVEYRDLAIWLLKNTRLFGSDRAIANLIEYIDNETFVAYKVIWLNGIRLEEDLQLSDTVSLMRIESLPVQIIQEEIRKDNSRLFNWVKPEAVLLEEFSHEKIHFHQDTNNVIDQEKYSIESLDIYRLLITVIGERRAAQAIGSSILFSDNIPNFNGISCSIHEYRYPPQHASFLNLDADSLISLYAKVSKLEYGKQQKIKNVLIKLNQFYSTRDYVDRSIIIRTLLEMLFLDDNPQGELKYNLSYRVAKYFGKNFEERDEIRKVVSSVYSISSKAVHNGFLKDKDIERLFHLHKNTIGWIRDFIIELIDDKIIDWNKVLLE